MEMQDSAKKSVSFNFKDDVCITVTDDHLKTLQAQTYFNGDQMLVGDVWAYGWPHTPNSDSYYNLISIKFDDLINSEVCEYTFKLNKLGEINLIPYLKLH